MSLILERLLFIVSPLFAATTKGKPKPAKKAVKKPVKRAAQPTRAKPKSPRAKQAVRASTKSAHSAPAKKGGGQARSAEPIKSASASAKPAAAQVLPKPVPPAGRAILLSPENDKFTDHPHPTFRWLSVGGAARYEIAWSEDAVLNASHSIFSVATEATVPAEKPLRFGVTYFWRVRGGNESGWGPWSAISSFRVLDETA